MQKYKKACYQEKDIVQCCSCDYWIHNNINCYDNIMNYGKCYLNCHHTEMSNVEDNNNQGEINNNYRTYITDDDDISEFNIKNNSDNSEDRSNMKSVVSEFCNTFFIKLNTNKSSDIAYGEGNDSLPKIISIPNSVTTTLLNLQRQLMSIKNVIADNATVEDNINPVNEIITDKNLLEFVFLSIENLEVRSLYFVECESFLRTKFLQNSYLLNYIPVESTQNYIGSIETLFE